MLIRFKEDMQDAVWEWAEAVTPHQVPVIWAEPNVRRPDEDTYVAMKITSLMIKPGHDALIPNSDGSWRVGGQRTFMVSVHAYGAEAQQVLMDLHQSLDVPSIIERFRSNGLAVHNIPTVTDTSLELETGFEDRATMEVLFGIASDVDVVLTNIDNVEMEGELTGTETHETSVTVP